MGSPKVSVIMGVYKEPIEWLHQSIDSILQQTFSDFEFIIICDNPSYLEGTALLNEYAEKDKRIVLIRNESNVGLTKSLNKGLDAARGQYIARMDADDISLPDRLSKQVDFMDGHPNVDVCGASIINFGTRGGIQIYPENNEDILFFIDNFIVHPTALFRKSIATMRYDEKCVVAQDYELWCRAYMNGATFHNLQEPLLRYRNSGGQISSKRLSEQRNTARQLRRLVLDHYLCSNGYAASVGNKEITFDSIDNILSLQLPVKPCLMDQFLYYLLLSVKGPLLFIAQNILRRKRLRTLPTGYLARALNNAIRSRRNEKF